MMRNTKTRRLKRKARQETDNVCTPLEWDYAPLARDRKSVWLLDKALVELSRRSARRWFFVDVDGTDGVNTVKHQEHLSTCVYCVRMCVCACDAYGGVCAGVR